MEETLKFLPLLGERWVEALTALVLLGMGYYGWRRGLVKMSVSFVTLLVSAAASRMALPYVKQWVEGNERLWSVIEERAQRFLLSAAESSGPGTAATGENGLSLLPGNGIAAASGAAAEPGAAELFYRLIGLDRLTDYIAERISNLIITVIVFLLLLLAVRILVKLLFALLDLIMMAPGLSLVNRSLGAALGLIEALFYIWITLIVISFLPENALSRAIAQQFNAPGGWLSFIKDSNLIVRIFAAVL